MNRSDNAPQPKPDANGVPWCDEDGCHHYDGKRCQLIGARPSSICEPAVVGMAAELVQLRGAK